ncbi:MAG: hypothetical protein H0U18_04340 [Pyrinomonadaceae bacterium]|nr:hypothetical protein [Pyrinomonadaceae bacterium]
MNLSRNVSEMIREHVTLEVESIDRMYLNIYQPQLQRDLGVVGFFRHHRGQAFASSSLMATMTRTFVTSIESFAKAQKIPLITFQKGQRKDDIAASYRAKFSKAEGVVFIGKAQEKASVFRTEKRYQQQSGKTYPWIVRSTAMVNHYTSMRWIETSAPSSSSSVLTFLTTPSSASTATSMPSSS